VAAIAILACGLFAGADWTRFRGPNAGGTADDKGLPVRWSGTENVAWKTALPGAGASSPVTLGDKIFLTCYSGYPVNPDQPGDLASLVHHTLCLDRASGRILWDKTEKAQLPEKSYSSFLTKHGYASATPATDGKAVYVFFGRSGVFAYSLAGEKLWQADVGSNIHDWGSAASPILYKNLLIVNASIESSSIVALDTADGKQVWRAGGINRSWGTPLIVDLPEGRQELVVSLQGKVLALDPAKGQELWHCDGVPDYICPSVIAHGDVVYITAGRKPLTLAVRAGGQGDVTGSRVLWQVKKTPKVATPLYADGMLYWVDQTGKAVCINASDGSTVYEQKQKIAGGDDKVYASPVLGDGKLYIATRRGGVIVLAVGKQFQELAHNDLGDDSLFNATPVISNRQLLVRSDKYLYCIGK
jgi:outer membrane protein assembly factor BamB